MGLHHAKGDVASSKSGTESAAVGVRPTMKKSPRTANAKSGATKRVAKSRVADARSAAQLIDARIEALGDWRADTLARAREIIRRADPDVVEEWKWNVPVWSHAGIVCTGETYKQTVKLTFAHGAALPDPDGLFNSSLEGATRRAIDFRAGDKIDAKALQALVRAAVARNTAQQSAANTMKSSPRKTVATRQAPKRPASKAGQPVLLSGGNPQIAKAEGDAPVQAYIAAMPGWKRDLGSRLDALITGAVPGVRKAVKWNSPFYGVEGGGWFLSFHCFAKYVKVAFFRGASLRPLPPGASKQKHVRYLDLHEHDPLDEAQFTAWVRQASQLPGERM